MSRWGIFLCLHVNSGLFTGGGGTSRRELILRLQKKKRQLGTFREGMLMVAAAAIA